jgi:hypothetical protein
MAAELGRYLNIDETTLSSPSTEISQSSGPETEPRVHEQAPSAVHEGATTNSIAGFEYVRGREPLGGVEQWWARVLNGSLINSETVSG